jgi:siroheme decarboxylase
MLDAIDRAIINHLQKGFPVCPRPYAKSAAELGLTEDELITRLDMLLIENRLSRFGPMYNAERLGGAVTLAAMQVPKDDFERVAGIVNALPQVAHNYEREHAFNMWFVLAAENPEQLDAAIADIAGRTGYPVFNMPKLEEFYIGLQLEV